MSRNHPTVLLLFFCFWQMPVQAYTVRGNIPLGEDWGQKIYLSLVPTFDDLNTASADFIVNVADIRPDGSFLLKGGNLPAAERLYRLHVCKKGDPAATLFIGGKEENHLHFIMQNSSDMTFSSDGLFQNAQLRGHPATPLLLHFDWEVDLLRQPPKVNSQVNRDRRRQRLQELLLTFADTCSHPIPAMLALDRLDLETLLADRAGFLEKKLEEWAATDAASPYLQNLQRQVALLQPTPARKWLWEGLFGVALLLGYFFLRRKLEKKEEPRNPESSLSVQERRVFQLLSGGKSNKEISAALNIEVSTVKSHVSSIYSKLGVRSRKEVFKLK